MIIDVTPFVVDCSEDEQACKVLEEAAEVFAAWQALDVCGASDICMACSTKCAAHIDFADEIADVIQVACNLAYRYGCFEQVEMCHMELANVGALGSKCDDKTMAVAVLQEATLLYSYWWRSVDMVDKSLTETEKQRLASRVDGLIMYAVAFAERYAALHRKAAGKGPAVTDAKFCLNLRRQMLRAGITQATLAKKLGVTRPCVHNWYWGVCEPNIGSLRKIRRVLGCTFEDLIGG